MSEINRSSLEEEFDMENEDRIEIETFKEVLNKAKNIDDPYNVLTTLIEKAGTFLDMIETESVNGGMNARYCEVASQMMNTILSATNSVAEMNNTIFDNNIKTIKSKQKDKEIELKDKELEIKKMYYQAKQITNKGDSQNNIIVTDREQIMKFLSNKENKQIE